MNQGLLDLPSEIHPLCNTSSHWLPITFSEGMTREECVEFVKDPIPVYWQWPTRINSTEDKVLDIYKYFKPQLIGQLYPLGLIIENKSVVLHAQLTYTQPGKVPYQTFDNISLMTLSVDRVTGDPQSGRQVVGLSRAVIASKPQFI